MKGEINMFSSVVLIILIAICIICHFAFVLPKRDKMLFALYEDRDELALYAMEHSGKQETLEYQYLMKMINVEIYLINNNISLTDYFSSVVENTVENQKEVEEIISLIEQDDFLKKIYEHSFCIFSKYIRRKFKIFNILCLKPLIKVLTLLEKILSLINETNKASKYKDINNIYETASNMPEIFGKYIKMNKPI